MSSNSDGSRDSAKPNFLRDSSPDVLVPYFSFPNQHNGSTGSEHLFVLGALCFQL